MTLCNCVNVLCPGTLVLDHYTASNGTAVNGHSPDTGPSAAVADASFDIQSNKARQTGGSGVCLASYESNVADVTISATLQVTTYGLSGSHDFGLIGRYVDSSNYWLLVADSGPGVLLLQEVTSGSFTTRASASMGTAGLPFLTLATNYTMTLVVTGSSITGTLGATSLNYTSSAHATATKHGLIAYAPYGGTYTFDDFTVSCA